MLFWGIYEILKVWIGREFDVGVDGNEVLDFFIWEFMNLLMKI